MSDDKTWRDAKIPKWVAESVEREIKAHKLTAALSWPTEPRPEPLPFRWGEYDRLTGEPVSGVYWNARGERFELREQDGKTGSTWKSWIFSTDGNRWTTSVERGPLFDNERDARLHILWNACEKAAKELLVKREHLYR